MATVDITNWDEKNTASVSNLSDSTSFTSLQKVQPVKITEGSSSGTGDAQFSSSTWNNISSNDDIVVTKSDESTTRAYEIEELDTNNNVAWIWVYGSWDSDDSDQIVIGAGTGDGTDYSSGGTGSNPWEQTGINAEAIYHLNESSGSTIDSSSNFIDSNSTTGTTYDVSGEIDGARSFDGSDDKISFTDPDQLDPGSNAFTVLYWHKVDSDPSVNVVVDKNGFDTGYLSRYNEGQTELRTRIDDGTDAADNNTSVSSLAGDGSFHQIVFSRDTSSSLLRQFLDTSALGTADTSSVGSISNSTDFNIGAEFDSDNATKGDIDEVRYYSEEKTQITGWIQADYDASPSGGQVFFSWGGPTSTTTVVSATVSDSLGFAENTQSILSFTASDSLGFTENDQGTLIDTLSDSLTFAENIQTKLKDTLTDQLDFSENQAAQLIDTLTDSLSFTENTIAQLALTVTATDNLTFSENVDAQLIDTIQESLGFTENVQGTLIDSFADQLGFTENVQIAIVEILSDQLNFTEETSTQLADTLTDSLTFAENMETQLIDTLTDQLGFTEATASAVAVRLSDNLQFSEDVNAVLTATLSDQLDFNEETAGVLLDTLSDQLTLSEQVVFASLLTINAPSKAIIINKNRFAVMENHTFTEGDTADELSATLEDEDGAIDLSKAKRVELDIKDRQGNAKFDNKTISIDDAANGKVTYAWSSNDPVINEAGVYRGKFVIIDNVDKPESVPNDGWFTIEVEEQV